MAWHGMVWYGMVGRGMIWHGMVWHGEHRRDHDDRESMEIRCREMIGDKCAMAIYQIRAEKIRPIDRADLTTRTFEVYVCMYRIRENKRNRERKRYVH